MIFCFEGISGAGKTSLISELENYFKRLGFPVVKYHFYSDIKTYSPNLNSQSSYLEKKFFQVGTSLNEQIEILKQLCFMACSAFLQCDWNQNNIIYLFDRSPLTYLAYVKGGYSIDVKLWAEFYETTKQMRPLILKVDIDEANARNTKRYKLRKHNIIHGCDSEISKRVQQYYLMMERDPFCLDILPSEGIVQNVINRL